MVLPVRPTLAMIELSDVWKTFHTAAGPKVVARGLTFTVPSGIALALMGRNGAGKSTLLRMISGSLEPDRGTIRVTGSMSWPVGFRGSFHPDLTATQNVRFIARVYGVDTDELVEAVRDFAELGNHFNEPIRTYSSGMRSRLAFGLSMSMNFDIYLVDEVTAVGDRIFKKKSQAVFAERLRHSGAIMVSHSTRILRDLCQHAAFLENGKITYFTDIEEAIRYHDDILTYDDE